MFSGPGGRLRGWSVGGPAPPRTGARFPRRSGTSSPPRASTPATPATDTRAPVRNLTPRERRTPARPVTPHGVAGRRSPVNRLGARSPRCARIVERCVCPPRSGRGLKVAAFPEHPLSQKEGASARRHRRHAEADVITCRGRDGPTSGVIARQEERTGRMALVSFAVASDRADLETARAGGQRPPGIHARDRARRSRPCSSTLGPTWAGLRDCSCCALHSAHAGRQERLSLRCLTKRQKALAFVLVDRVVWDERVGELDREGEVVVVTVALPHVEDQVADTCRTAAAAVRRPRSPGSGVRGCPDSRRECRQARSQPRAERPADSLRRPWRHSSAANSNEVPAGP